MEARSAERLPSGSQWQYEPKWDGFRCLAFRSRGEVVLESKNQQPLGRYFPELVAALMSWPEIDVVFDGEIVIFDEARHGAPNFDALLQRIHPAESRIQKLSRETPARYFVFDLLVKGKRSLTAEPLRERRRMLEALFAGTDKSSRIQLSPATLERNEANSWFQHLGPHGMDGVMAKRLDATYAAGSRDAILKIKRLRTADCVVGGFRWSQTGGRIGSLLLGLYDGNGRLNHVGYCASFSGEERKALEEMVEPLRGGAGFSGSHPGGPSRWSGGRETSWEPLRPELVCEVRYDHFSGGRFRHGTKFLHWRPEKSPRQCTYEQILGPAQGKAA